MKQAVVAILSLALVNAKAPAPIAIFHGLGDACTSPGMASFEKQIEEGTGASAHCIETGLGATDGYFDDMQEQADAACEKVKANEELQGDFNVIGLSQGGLLARYIVEQCDMKGKVRKLVSMGGPHMGTDVKHCFHGPLCGIINEVAPEKRYSQWVQGRLGPAGYFRDTHQKYLTGSMFLPELNNEINSGQAAAKRGKFLALDGAMFLMFTEDTMFHPKETAWFQTVDNQGRLQALEDSGFYKNDLIGLKTLNEAGKLTFGEIKGDHLQFSLDDSKDSIVQFLVDQERRVQEANGVQAKKLLV